MNQGRVKVSPAFSKAAGFQRAAPFGRLRRGGIPAAPFRELWAALKPLLTQTLRANWQGAALRAFAIKCESRVAQGDESLHAENWNPGAYRRCSPPLAAKTLGPRRDWRLTMVLFRRGRGSFALCGARPGALPRDPTTFEKVDQTFFCASRLLDWRAASTRRGILSLGGGSDFFRKIF